MPISHSHKLVFIHIPKTAVTAITESPEVKFESLNGHFTRQETKMSLASKCDEYFKFTVVRNPWDRVVSNYKYSRMIKSYWHSNDGSTKYSKHVDYDVCSKLSFEDCVKLLQKNPNSLRHQGWKPQYPYVCDADKNIVVDKVFDYSDLDGDEFKKIIPKMERINVSQGGKESYKDYYNDELIDIVSEFYKEDIKIFNFKY